MAQGSVEAVVQESVEAVVQGSVEAVVQVESVVQVVLSLMVMGKGSWPGCV